MRLSCNKCFKVRSSINMIRKVEKLHYQMRNS
jgi:hypothetical protein